MPFSEKAIDGSVLELVETGAQVDPEFEDGFATWKEQQGGVFDLTVAETIDDVVSVIPPQHAAMAQRATRNARQRPTILRGGATASRIPHS